MTYTLKNVLSNFQDAYQFLWDTTSSDKKVFVKGHKFSAEEWSTGTTAQYLDFSNGAISERVRDYRHIFEELGIYTKEITRYFPIQAVVFLSLLAKSGKASEKSIERRKLLGYSDVPTLVKAVEECLGIAPVIPIDEKEVEEKVTTEEEEMLSAIADFARDFDIQEVAFGDDEGNKKVLFSDTETVTYSPSEARKIIVDDVAVKATTGNSVSRRIKEIEKEEEDIKETIDKLWEDYKEKETPLLAQIVELRKEYSYLIKHV